MTNNEIIEAFQEFIDDSMTESVMLALANQAKQELEIELKLQCSKKLDTSQSVSSGSTYLTQYSLQSDVLVPVGHYIYVGTEQYTGIPFEHREQYKNITGHWYTDLFNLKFHLTGTPPSGQQITFPYIAKGDDIAANDTTVLKWPTGTHILVPMRMAQLWFAIDQDKLNNFIAEWGGFYEQTKRQLINWDHSWKLASIGGSTPYGQQERYNPDAINSIS